MITHKSLLALYNNFEFGNPLEGICHGFILCWLEACILGEEQQFDRQIRHIIHREKELPKFLDEIKKIGVKYGQIRRKCLPHKAKHDRAHYFKKISDALKDEELFTLFVFFHSITLYHAPWQHANLWNNRYVAQSDVEAISLHTSSDGIIKRGGLKRIYFESLIYTEEEIKYYLDELGQALDQSYNSKNVLGIILCNHNHSIGLSYQPDVGWKFMDLNQYDTKVLYPKSTPVIAKKIMIAFNQKKHLYVAFHVSIVTTLACYKQKKKKINDPLNNLKQSHSITQEIAQRLEDVNLLFIACDQGDIKCVYELIRAGANINQANNDGATSLYMAAQNGHVECVNELIKAGAEINQVIKNNGIALHIASGHGHTGCVSELIKAGAKVNQVSNEGFTSLYMAAQNGHLGCVSTLIKAGANINQANNKGATSLYIAAQNGHTECMSKLIKAGTAINQANNDGLTPLYIAVQNGHIQCMLELIKAGANINQATNNGWTSLHLAAQNGHIECVRELIKAGADINQASNEGWASLYLAAKYGHTECVNELMKETQEYQIALDFTGRAEFLDELVYGFFDKKNSFYDLERLGNYFCYTSTVEPNNKTHQIIKQRIISKLEPIESNDLFYLEIGLNNLIKLSCCITNPAIKEVIHLLIPALKNIKKVHIKAVKKSNISLKKQSSEESGLHEKHHFVVPKKSRNRHSTDKNLIEQCLAKIEQCLLEIKNGFFGQKIHHEIIDVMTACFTASEEKTKSCWNKKFKKPSTITNKRLKALLKHVCIYYDRCNIKKIYSETMDKRYQYLHKEVPLDMVVMETIYRIDAHHAKLCGKCFNALFKKFSLEIEQLGLKIHRDPQVTMDEKLSDFDVDYQLKLKKATDALNQIENIKKDVFELIDKMEHSSTERDEQFYFYVETLKEYKNNLVSQQVEGASDLISSIIAALRRHNMYSISTNHQKMQDEMTLCNHLFRIFDETPSSAKELDT